MRWRLWRRAGTSSLPFRLGAALCGGALVLALVGPVLLGGDPSAQDLYHVLQPPSWRHPCGTDAFGRDILVRLVYGLRLTLMEIAVSLTVAAGIGVPIGLFAGFAPRWVDGAVMTISDVLFAFPGLVLALLVVSLLGPGLFHALLAIAAFSVPVYIRLGRTLAAGMRHLLWVEALTVLGAGRTRVLLRHVLPNAATPLLVQATLSGGTVVLAAASLSFLGLGAQPPLPEWGTMMSDGRNALGAAFWPCLFPGLSIAVTVIGLNCLGDGLRERFGAPGEDRRAGSGGEV
ncbi:ABC transporter permease [Acidomonas methanolica]|uniref:ABC transporter permease n=1 Tax=Acidomonas methanolica TaxID=437 RepID=UPI00211A4E67|nr:ABC transporter permease [Acidomonas methanolica]MCQ9156899.1 ABC transporter permease [Acidomonas methanolica]